MGMSGSSPSASDLPAAVARGIQSHREGPGPSGVARAVVSESGWMLLETALRNTNAMPAILVIDGFDRLGTTQFVHELLLLCRRLFTPTIRVDGECSERDDLVGNEHSRFQCLDCFR